MNIDLTADQKAFVQDAIASGRVHDEVEAIHQALALWERRERARAQILAGVDAAEASIARGQGRVITRDSMQDLAGEVKQRGRARLAAEQAPKA
jgi:Arc/MetJ-type ribon-helix-helix transcriptional regulator